MRPVERDNDKFELGTWVGRRQAFGLIASKCSAADAECLKRLRASKRYRLIAVNWEDFCSNHLGLSRASADRIIRQLKEFGSAYFDLSEIVRIPESAYRTISGAITDSSIEYKGKKIPINKENAERIADVITLLRRESERLQRPRTLAEVSLRLDNSLCQLARMGKNPDTEALIEHLQERLTRVFYH